MSIHLPSYDQLTSDEQRPVYNLPLDNNYVVRGAPGTGKSILALYRAARVKSDGDSANVKFLIFNKPLRKYLAEAVLQLKLANSSVDSWQRWYHRGFLPWYNPKFSQHLTVEETLSGGDPGWNTICKNVEAVPVADRVEHWEHLILDEAQDLPSGLIKLLSLLTKNATIFVDPHQRILSNSDELIIENIMSYFSADQRVFALTRNFRNTEEISRVAQCFYVGQAGDLPAPASKHGPKPRLILSSGIGATAQFIANIADNNPGTQVGVIVRSNKSRDAYFSAVSSKVANVPVQFYDTDHDDQFDFNRTGVKIMNTMVMKGLEFDFVVIPELGGYPDNELTRNVLYVASTRAQRELVYVYAATERTSFAVQKLQSLNSTEQLVDEESL